MFDFNNFFKNEFKVKPRKWMKLKCWGCKQTITTNEEEAARLCADCRERVVERRAHVCDANYDSTKLNDWEDCEKALAKLGYIPAKELPHGTGID